MTSDDAMLRWEPLANRTFALLEGTRPLTTWSWLAEGRGLARLGTWPVETRRSQVLPRIRLTTRQPVVQLGAIILDRFDGGTCRAHGLDPWTLDRSGADVGVFDSTGGRVALLRVRPGPGATLSTRASLPEASRVALALLLWQLVAEDLLDGRLPLTAHNGPERRRSPRSDVSAAHAS